MGLNNHRILVIANEALSYNKSNGRTALMLLEKVDKKNIYQFYLHGEPDNFLVDHSFCVSDEDVIKCTFPFLSKKQFKNNGDLSEQRLKRNCKNLFFRDFAWRRFRWWNKEFKDFLYRIKPDIILLMAGDAPFMLDISIKIKKMTDAKLLVFTTENYVLKEKLYNYAHRFSMWHFLLRLRLLRSFKKLIKKASCFIFNSSFLQDAYLLKYPKIKRSEYIMNSSTTKTIKYKKTDTFTISYLGNMGVGRCECLNEIATVIDDLNSDMKFVLCGQIPSYENKMQLLAHRCVDYKGVVNYEEVIKIMRSSSLILHCENIEQINDLKMAFSTKLADMLTIGVPMLIYASRSFPFVRYLESHKAAHIAETKNDLRNILTECYLHFDYLTKNIDSAVCLSKENHDANANSVKMVKIIEECFNV